MHTESVHYDLDDGVATVCIDDGKRNALSPAVLRGIRLAFDRARADGAAVILTGRDEVFSAGFDLNVMQRGGLDALRMLAAGYALTARIMTHPFPVVAACNGHALAMGMFLMLSADNVIGSRGDFRIAANEVAIGLTLPRVAATVLRNRLAPAAFQRAAALSAYFDVDAALGAGIFDELVDPTELGAVAASRAAALLQLDPRAHAATKRRIRAATIRRIRMGLPLDLVDAALTGIRRARQR